ncbi:MAG: hypothetical protein Kow0069_35180 [Promethearchaeota archaeon]
MPGGLTTREMPENRKIAIEAPELGRVEAVLRERECPATCKAVWEALPQTVHLSRWGDELYGEIDASAPPENPREECEVGDVAYWLDGSGFCILFGRTPASTSDKPRLVSPGNVFAKVEGDPSVFRNFDALTVVLKRVD